MINFHKDHASLVNVALVVFVVLSTGIAVAPANQMQHTDPLPDMPKMTDAQRRGLAVYVSEGCMACHTQQVRNIEMDKTWGYVDPERLPLQQGTAEHLTVALVVGQ